MTNKVNAHIERKRKRAGASVTVKGGRKPPGLWEHPTLEQLAKQQGVKPVEKFEDLLGDFWPADEDIDEFNTEIRRLRNQSTNHHDLDA